MNHSTQIIQRLLSELDESNYHPRGNNWQHLNELLDVPSGVHGDLAAWVVAIGCEWIELRDEQGLLLDDGYHSLTPHLSRLACEMLSLSQDEWSRIECLMLDDVRKQLANLLCLILDDARKQLRRLISFQG